MSASESFDRLLSRVGKGQRDEVARLIVQRFAGRLACLLASRMSEDLRRRVDAEDAAQSVFLSFFKKHDQGRWELRDWDSLWGLLAQTAVWRICRYAEHHRAERRSTEKEAPLADEAALLDREPSPEEVLIAQELYAQVLARTPPTDRLTVPRTFEGWSQAEIAKEQGISISTVQRQQRRARQTMAELEVEEAMNP